MHRTMISARKCRPRNSSGRFSHIVLPYQSDFTTIATLPLRLSPLGDLASTVESASAAYFGITVAPHEYFDQTGWTISRLISGRREVALCAEGGQPIQIGV